MKKFVLALLLVLLFSFSIASGDEEIVLTPFNVNDLIKLGDKQADVADFIAQFGGMECENGAYEDGDTYIYCTFDYEDGMKETYELQFDGPSEEMYQIISEYILPEGSDYSEWLEKAAEYFNLMEDDVYTTPALEKKCEKFDVCASALINDGQTILTIGGNNETADNYAIVKLFFFDRKWEVNEQTADGKNEEDSLFAPYTMNTLFPMGMKKTDVETILKAYGVENISSDESSSFTLGKGKNYSNTLTCETHISTDYGEENDFYTFYFNKNSELYEIEVIMIFPENTDVEAIIQGEYELLGLEGSEDVTSQYSYCDDIEMCGAVQKDGLVYVIGGNSETSEKYGKGYLVYFDAR